MADLRDMRDARTGYGTAYETTYDERTALLDEDDGIQHGIDGDPNGDAEKGATAGAIGGAIVGAAAGAMMGPAGAVIGAVAGGVVGGVASGGAVAWIDRHDNDNTITGLGAQPIYTDPVNPYNPYGNSTDINSSDAASGYTSVLPTGVYAPTTGLGVPGIAVMPASEYDVDAVNRGTWEESGSSTTPFPRIEDLTASEGLNGESVPIRPNTYTETSAMNSGIGTGFSKETELGERTASFKTGGVANDGTPDTRGIGEKFADAITGDDVDDKTGRIVDHP